MVFGFGRNDVTADKVTQIINSSQAAHALLQYEWERAPIEIRIWTIH